MQIFLYKNKTPHLLLVDWVKILENSDKKGRHCRCLKLSSFCNCDLKVHVTIPYEYLSKIMYCWGFRFLIMEYNYKKYNF